MKKPVLRTCAACGEKKDKSSMLRVIRTPEGTVEVDPTGRKNGRGVYVCRKGSCLDLLKKKKVLSSQLKVTVPPEIFEEIAREIEKG
ncbi:MAG: YlxR family protein [Lachnospiraceae bacterium]|jgi:predicted RNA-binding protein YlxR (DUF448 family)|nr:YlxR family protein [Lachnospiraceae bacterium]MEE3460698.1 YlxR family protein [Lachnospiraceae bacterium]